MGSGKSTTPTAPEERTKAAVVAVISLLTVIMQQPVEIGNHKNSAALPASNQIRTSNAYSETSSTSTEARLRSGLNLISGTSSRLPATINAVVKNANALKEKCLIE